MAKKHANGSTVVVDRAATGAEQSRSLPAGPGGGAVQIARPASSGWIEPVGETVAVTVRTVRGLLPSRLPVFLATAALLVTGLIDPPVALGAGLALEALRRWEPETSR